MNLLQSLVPSFNRSSTSPVRRNSTVADRDLGPTVRPTYTLKETDDAYGATVYLPGVTKEGLEIDAENGVLTVVGRRSWKQPETWTSLYRETPEATFVLSLRHDQSIDVDKTSAELRDGVLRLSLPKSEALKPRKIAVA
ncbi:MAG: Hsp20/alpha crystallin family protein [Opitutaceae bacterium]